jgi:hypothetical protein
VKTRVKRDGDRPRYGLRWQLRDAARSLAFVIRCRPARWFGWACLAIAAWQATLALLWAFIPAGWAMGVTITGAALGIALVAVDAFRELR